uniref:Putative secreted protein n=1 Tax=Ixodes ricinus TaxID=34613 RepID=A0A6B0UCY3_IXORI
MTFHFLLLFCGRSHCLHYIVSTTIQCSEMIAIHYHRQCWSLVFALAESVGYALGERFRGVIHAKGEPRALLCGRQEVPHVYPPHILLTTSLAGR